MQALILAGGKGTRLRPYTTVLPKPLMPIGDYPILEILLRQLARHGVDRVILAVGTAPHLFQALFADGSRLGIAIEYIEEPEPMGTAGPIGLALDRLDESFLVLNGDLLTTLSFSNLFNDHLANGAAATIGVIEREVPIDFGVLVPDESSRLVEYHEKPIHRFTVSMGVYALTREKVRPYLPPGQPLDIPHLMKALLESGNGVRCFREACRWLDIGRVDDYQAAQDLFETHASEFLGPV